MQFISETRYLFFLLGVTIFSAGTGRGRYVFACPFLFHFNTQGRNSQQGEYSY